MTWDPRAFLAGGGFQPGGIMGGPGQGGQMPAPPAAGGGAPPPGTGTAPLPWGHGPGGGMPSLQDFWSRVRNAGGQVHDGLRNARMDFRDRLIDRFGQLPAMMGMQPRPGGTAGGGWQFPRGHFQMPPGFAANLPWGQGAAPGGGPGAMGGTVPSGVAAGEPNPSAPAGYGMNARSPQSDVYDRMAKQNTLASGHAHRNDDTGEIVPNGTSKKKKEY